MKIIYRREQFATNSSSDHSFILVKDSDIIRSNPPDQDMEYGWSQFVLKSPQQKFKYILMQLMENLKRKLLTEQASALVFNYYLDRDKYFNLINYSEFEEYCDLFKKGHVDHQSCLCFPIDFLEKDYQKDTLPSKEFFRDFLDSIVLNDNVIIEGGNDNDDERDYIRYKEGNKEIDLNFMVDLATSPFCRKDNGLWILFHSYTGNKVRLSLKWGEDHGS